MPLTLDRGGGDLDSTAMSIWVDFRSTGNKASQIVQICAEAYLLCQQNIFIHVKQSEKAHIALISPLLDTGQEN